MNEKPVEEIINEELSADDRAVALDFAAFLRDNELEFVRDRGYWRDKIYFLVQYNHECVCFMAINDPDEKETAWKHVDLCGHCGSCGGGKDKVIFGKKFDRVCGCTFRFDNPDRNDLSFMKKMVELKIRELRVHLKEI